MLSKVEYALKQHNMINDSETIAVGISGGADSVALFLMLCEYKKTVDFTIKALHVNHMIRKEAGEDEEFVKELCARHGVELKCVAVDVPSLAEREHLSTEEAGRIARYRELKAIGAHKIAVGHHRDDLAETVLLNLCRGTGLHGITGIPPVSDNIIRPLLYVTRAEIEEYLYSLNQPYQTDKTNFTEDYARNRIRLNTIPYLKKEINAGAVEHISNMAGDMLELEEYIGSEIEKLFGDICIVNEENQNIQIDRKRLSELNPYMARELLLKVLEKLTPGRKDISRVHINSILNLLQTQGEKQIALPCGLKAVASYDYIVVGSGKEAGLYGTSYLERNKADNIVSTTGTAISISNSMEILLPTKMEEEVRLKLWNGAIVKLRKTPHCGQRLFEDIKYTKFFDYDKIKCSPVFRTRKQGDYLIVNNAGQKKSLKEYMINEKIPRHLRDTLPLLSDGEHIIWVLGYRISAKYRVDENTKTILEVSLVHTDKL